MATAKKILIVLTSHDKLADTGKQTGYYLPEVAHPLHVFKEAGFSVDFCSPQGGTPPCDEGSKAAFAEDAICKAFDFAQVANTKTPAQVNPADYNAIFYAGGHGTMFDFDNAKLAEIGAAVYEKGGVVGAVCHGPAGLLTIKVGGDFLIKGKKVTGFSNEEEGAVGLAQTMPYSLEDRMKGAGGVYSCGPNWGEYVQSDSRVVTGQNPASSTAAAKEIVKALSS